MVNLRMQEALKNGEAIDVSSAGTRHPHFEGVWVLSHFEPDLDYCNGEDERWIISVGRSKADGTIYASEDNRFYQNPAFDCLWLR